jgi:hypothetical protein
MAYLLGELRIFLAWLAKQNLIYDFVTSWPSLRMTVLKRFGGSPGRDNRRVKLRMIHRNGLADNGRIILPVY